MVGPVGTLSNQGSRLCLGICQSVWSELEHRLDNLRANNGEQEEGRLWNHDKKLKFREYIMCVIYILNNK